MKGLGFSVGWGSGGAPGGALSPIATVTEAPREIRYLNTRGAGSYPDETGTIVTWAAGDNAAAGTAVSVPWLTLSNITSLTAGRYVVYVNASTDASAPATHTTRLTIPASVDVVLVPVVNGAILKPANGLTAQSRIFDVSGNSAVLRLRRGPGNAVFRIDAAAMTSTAAIGVFQIASELTGTYGLEIDGAHSVFDSASGTVERMIVSFLAPLTYAAVQAAPSGVPTFIFKNGFKLVGEGGNIRGVFIGHLGSGAVTVNGMDFGGTAAVAATGGTPIPRDLNNKGLLNVDTANAGASVTISNTYGEFIPSAAASFSGVRIFDCNVIGRNLAHKLRHIAGVTVKPTWSGGWNQDNAAAVDGYYCEITGTTATPAGMLFLAGADGNEQPRLTLSSNTPGAGITCYAEWDFFETGDVGKIVHPGPYNGTTQLGTFEITAVVDARRATVTLTEACTGGVTMTAFQLQIYVVDKFEWRIGNRLVGGELRNGSTRGPDIADSTVHGAFSGGGRNFTIRNVESRYAAPGVAFKNATGCLATGNRTRNVPVYAQHLICKGATDCEFFDNESYLESVNAYEGGGIRNSQDDYGIPSTGNIFRQNRMHVTDSGYAPASVGLLTIDSVSNAQMIGNHWLMQDASAVPALFNYSGLTNQTFAQYLSQPFVSGDS